MSVHRVILRLDHKPNFRMMDSPGRVMESILEQKNDVWTEVKENAAKRHQVSNWTSEDKKTFRQFIVEPTAMIGSMESVDGVDLAKLFDDTNFRVLLATMDTLIETFKVSEVGRAGFRIWCFRGTAEGANPDALLAKQIGYLPNDVRDKFFGIIGAPQDVGVRIIGEHADRIKYSLSWGPYFREREHSKYLEHLVDEFKKNQQLDRVLDLDFFENDFVLPVNGVGKWLRSLVEKGVEIENLSLS